MSGFPHPPSSHVPLASVSSAPELDGWLSKVNLGGSELGVMFALCLLQCTPTNKLLEIFFSPAKFSVATNSLDGVLLVGLCPQLSASQSRASPRSLWGQGQGSDLLNRSLTSDVGPVLVCFCCCFWKTHSSHLTFFEAGLPQPNDLCPSSHSLQSTPNTGRQ